jgi:plasmid stabilization system protein ParE
MPRADRDLSACGARLVAARIAGVRRVALPRTRYLLYYRYLEADREVRVLRLWHASRGSKPQL